MRKSLAVLVITCAAASAFANPTMKTVFTVQGYSGSALANFPVMVRLSAATVTGFDYADCAADGADIIFEDASGNALDREIDVWNTNGESIVWVRLPSLENGATFTMKYGDADVTAQPTCQTNGIVWGGGGYVGVWHMNEINAKDSSTSGYDGTATTAALTVEAGAIGSAVNFSASSGTHSINTAATPNAELAGGLTIEAWVKLPSTSGNQAFTGKEDFATFKTENGQIVFTTPGKQDFTSGISISANQWYHLAVAFTPGIGAFFYVNGELSATVADTKNGFKNTTGSPPIRLGNNQWSQVFKGIMDECRISASVLSADWIAASYATSTTQGFLSNGGAENLTGSFVNVVGSPSDMGAPIPGYGKLDMSSGASTNLAMAVTVVAGEGSVTNYLTGWKIESYNGETDIYTPLRDSSGQGESFDSCAYVHGGGIVRFTWLWNPRNAFGVGAPALVAARPSSLDLSVPVQGIGYSGLAASLKIAYGPSAASLIYTNTVSAALTDFGDVPATLSRLAPDSTCYLKAILEVAGGERAESAVVSFNTASAPDLRICLPGIWQTWYPSTMDTPVDWTPDIWSLPVSTNWLGGADDATRSRRRELEPIAAYLGGNPGTSTATSAVWGDTVKWPRNTMQWVYAGYMHLEAGKTYSFRTHIDDRAYVAVTDISSGAKSVIIDENNESNYSDVNTGSFTAGATGWHPIEIRLWDGSGGAGAIQENGTYRNTSALGYMIDGYSVWDFLTDPGDGSLLRVDGGVETAERYANGALAYVDVTAPAGDLYVAFGLAEGTFETNTWSSVTKIATLSEPGTFTYTIPAEWGDDTHFAMAFYCDDGTAKAWSNPIYWRDTSLPTLTDSAADGTGGDVISVTGVLESFPGADCTLTVYTGASADSLTNVWSGLAGSTLSETGAFSLALVSSTDASDAHYFVPDSTIYLAVEAESNGRVARSAIIAVPVLGYVDSVSGSASFSKKTATFAWTLSGSWAQNSAAVKIFCGTSANEAAMTELVDCGNITNTLPYSSTATLDAFNTKYYFQVRAVATTAARATPLETRSPVFSATTFDTTTYIWQPVDGDWNGDWNDSRHWSSNSVDCIGYPDSSHATASFANCSTNNPVVVNVNGKYQVAYLRYYGMTAASDVTFAGNGTATSQLKAGGVAYSDNGNKNNLKAGTKVAYRDLTLVRDGSWDMVRDVNTSNLTYRFERVVTTGNDRFCVAVPASRIEFIDSTVGPNGNSFNFGGGGTVLLIDNSTITKEGGNFHLQADVAEAGRGPMEVVFRGAAPKIVSRNIFIYKHANDDGGVKMTFEVPEGGYSAVPLQIGNVKFGVDDAAAPVAKYEFAVSPMSPAIRRTRDKVRNMVVVSASAGFDTDRIVDGIGTVKTRRGVVCGEFKYGVDGAPLAEGAAPTTARQILVDYDGQHMQTMFIVY